MLLNAIYTSYEKQPMRCGYFSIRKSVGNSKWLDIQIYWNNKCLEHFDAMVEIWRKFREEIAKW